MMFCMKILLPVAVGAFYLYGSTIDAFRPQYTRSIFSSSHEITNIHMMTKSPILSQVDSDIASATSTVILTSAIFLSTGLISLPSPSFAIDIAKGETLFQANCAGCHAGGNNYVSEQRTLRKEAIKQFRGSTDQDVIQSFVQNGMPHKLLPMKTPMADNEYADVVAYVLDQALGEKW